jgi:hypothetical protein
VGSTDSSYKPGLQAWYLVVRMSELEKTLLEVMNKLSVRFDSYDRHITTLCSDLAKVQS